MRQFLVDFRDYSPKCRAYFEARLPEDQRAWVGKLAGCHELGPIRVQVSDRRSKARVQMRAESILARRGQSNNPVFSQQLELLLQFVWVTARIDIEIHSNP